MVKVKDGRHYMISTPDSIFEVFVFKVNRYRRYGAKVDWKKRILTFKSSNDAQNCFNELHHAEGVNLQLKKNKMSVDVPKRLVELVD